MVTIDDDITNRAVDFMQRQQKAGKPFPRMAIIGSNVIGVTTSAPSEAERSSANDH